MKKFNLTKEVNKLGVSVKGELIAGKPVLYEDSEYFYTKNFHPESLKSFIIGNKEKITVWCKENNRNISSALLGY